MEVIHTAIQVTDIDASKRFYIDGLGLEFKRQFTGEDGVENFYFGKNDGAQIQLKRNPERATAIKPDGIDHIAVSVEDVDQMVHHLGTELDYTVRQEPTDMDEIRFSYIEDPDGYVIELIEFY